MFGRFPVAALHWTVLSFSGIWSSGATTNADAVAAIHTSEFHSPSDMLAFAELVIMACDIGITDSSFVDITKARMMEVRSRNSRFGRNGWPPRDHAIFGLNGAGRNSAPCRRKVCA